MVPQQQLVKHIVLFEELCNEINLIEQDFYQVDIYQSRFGAVLRQGYDYITAVGLAGGELCRDDAALVELSDDRLLAIIDFLPQLFEEGFVEMQFGKFI